MADARFVLDEHLSTALAEALRRRGIDAVTLSEVGRLGLEDEDQLAWAETVSRVIVAHDADFLTIAGTVESHAGIAFCRARKYSIGDLLRRIEAMAARRTAAGWRNRVHFL